MGYGSPPCLPMGCICPALWCSTNTAPQILARREAGGRLELTVWVSVVSCFGKRDGRPVLPRFALGPVFMPVVKAPERLARNCFKEEYGPSE